MKDFRWEYLEDEEMTEEEVEQMEEDYYSWGDEECDRRRAEEDL